MSNMFCKKGLRKVLEYAEGGYKLSFWEQFLTVGQNTNQRVTEIFITIFFAFLNVVSHIEIVIQL